VILELKKLFITEGYSIPIDFLLDLSDIEFAFVKPLKKPISIKGEAANKAGVITLSMHYSVCYEAPCDRCGTEVANEFSFDTSYILATTKQSEENDEIILVTDTEFNLDELCRSDVLLHIPMKHLCREDCLGLCVNCGKNLNEGDCGCNKKQIDPRLEALAKLLD